MPWEMSPHCIRAQLLKKIASITTLGNCTFSKHTRQCPDAQSSNKSSDSDLNNRKCCRGLNYSPNGENGRPNENGSSSAKSVGCERLSKGSHKGPIEDMEEMNHT